MEVARYFRSAEWPPGTAHLKDQGTRSSDSVVLNLAEAAGRTYAARRNHLRIASGEAGEAFAVLDLVDLPGGKAQQQNLRRIGAMLSKLGR